MSLIRSSPFFDFLDSYDRDLRDFSSNKGVAQMFNKLDIVPAIDLTEKKNFYELRASIPGAAKADINVDYSNENHQLKISGEVPEVDVDETDVEGNHHKEIKTGSFERVVNFDHDSAIDGDKIQANYKNGILNVKLPKLKKSPPTVKKITIDED